MQDAVGLLDTSFERESSLKLEVEVIRADSLKAMDANGLSGTQLFLLHHHLVISFRIIYISNIIS